MATNAETIPPAAGSTGKPRAASAEAVPAIMRQGPVVPWLYLLPALVVMTVFIIYPGLSTFYYSLRNNTDTGWATSMCAANQGCWGIFENYHYALTAPIMLTAFFNNLLWILLMVSTTVALGLLIAVLADRVPYEAVAKGIIFLPMAISFVGAGVIWKFVYATTSGTTVQIGLLNAFITWLGGQPVFWLQTETNKLNTIALIVVGVWMWTGFCMTILAAALRGVPEDLQEAARVDGANEWRVFRHITLPTIMPTLTIVVTTMVINVLKIFDIVYVMTGGNYGTEVIANRMYQEQYSAQNTGRAAAIAVVLILVILPAMYFNIKRVREQEANR